MDGNIIILGAPGSGKGTLGKKLVNKYGYELISTGDILRQEKESNSEIGLKIKNLIGKGNLVPDDLINDIVKKKLKTVKGKFILDGYPRTVEQSIFLDKIAEISLVIYLEVSDETITKRILERGKTSKREDDQSVDIINRRIKQFKNETFPIIDIYENKKMLAYIDGEENIENVFKQAEYILNIWK